MMAGKLAGNDRLMEGIRLRKSAKALTAARVFTGGR